jgi:exosortase E/protease (VPEID-CTERM system)
MRPSTTDGVGATSPATPGDASDTPTVNPGLLAFRAAWVSLLLAEALALGLLFDSAPYLRDTRWWAFVLTLVPSLLGRLVVVTAVVTPLIGGRPLRDAFRHASGPEHKRLAWPFVLGHSAALAGFACLTSAISHGGLFSTAYPGGWVLAWVAIGAITLGTWVAVLLPRGFVRALGRPGAARLLVVVVVAATAVGTGLAWQRVFWAPKDNSPLVRVTYVAVSGLIGLFSSDPVCRPEEAVIGTRGFLVRVAPQCSGIEGMGLILVFLGIVLALWRRAYRFPHALLLLPLGVAALWLANVARIALLIAVGVWISPSVAVQGFHSQAGWLAFNGIALVLVLASRRIGFFTRPDPSADEAEYANPTAAYLVPVLAVIAATMITGAFSSGFDLFYPLRVLAAGAALWYFRRDHATLRWNWSWMPVAIGTGTFILWMALEPASTGTAAETALASGLDRLGSFWGTGWVCFRIVGSVVTVPLAEELAFRGYLTRRLIAAEFQEVPLGRFTWLSFVVSSALFGTLHGRWLAGMLAGMLYAFALYRRGELADAVVAHATTNALIGVFVLTTGSWSLWE